MRPAGILETSIYTSDLDGCEDFYSRVFGLKMIHKLDGKFIFFRAGQQMLLIFDPAVSAAPDPDNPIPRHGATGPVHICFRARDEAEVETWQRRLEAAGVPIEQVHRWPGGGLSVYVRDPAGNSVEVADGGLWNID